MPTKQYIKRVEAFDPIRAAELRSAQPREPKPTWLENELSEPRTLTPDETIEFDNWFESTVLGIGRA